ncbi:hypothetical protein [Streptomyces scopuliridis]|uniref:hypothetical protein n=1 Tax=Streptomyces scopuliridis TaxID=452529 RepID=UPI0035E2AE4F
MQRFCFRDAVAHEDLVRSWEVCHPSHPLHRSALLAGQHGVDFWTTGELFMARALEDVVLLELGLMNHSVKHANFSLGITLLG